VEAHETRRVRRLPKIFTPEPLRGGPASLLNPARRSAGLPPSHEWPGYGQRPYTNGARTRTAPGSDLSLESSYVVNEPSTRSLSNRRHKEITALHRRKYRARQGQTVVEGARAVEAAIDAGAPVTDLVLSAGFAGRSDADALLDRLAATRSDGEVDVWTVSDEEMAELSGVATSQGVLAVVNRQYVNVDDLAESPASAATVLALDGVQDPGNVGTIVRTAAWFGVTAVVAGPGTAGLYGPKVMRAAMGGHWDVGLGRTDLLGAALDRFRREGFQIYGADLYGTDARAWVPRHPSALVLGSEAHGLSADVLDRIDEPIAIPGSADRQGAESLNVAVASGILVYEWTQPSSPGHVQ